MVLVSKTNIKNPHIEVVPSNNKIYVGGSENSYPSRNIILVIDGNTNDVIKEIALEDYPIDIVANYKKNIVYVIGQNSDSDNATIYSINIVTDTVVNKTQLSRFLTIEDSAIYTPLL
jgi:YVTN family beta-propeller protein